MAQVFITGSTTGLGLATAETLLRNGHHVIVHARSRSRMTAVQHLMDQGAHCIVGELADPAQVRQIAEDANRIGGIDAVIHNAGVLTVPRSCPSTSSPRTCSRPFSTGRAA